MSQRADRAALEKVLRLILRTAIRNRQRARKDGTRSGSLRKDDRIVPELKVADELDGTPGYVRRIDHRTARRNVECIVAGCPRAQARERAN
jgi:hypothetical protein